MVTHKLSFTPGRITLLGQRELITSANFFAEYLARVNDDPKRFQELYDAAKVSYRGGTAVTIGKNEATSREVMLKWMTDLAVISGWGQLKWLEFDREKKMGALLIEDLPIPLLLKGRTKGCVDHIVRGFIAGGASAMLQSDVDTVEEECVASGAPACKFIFMPKDKLKSTAEAKRQFGIA